MSLNPDMPAQELRLCMGEITASEMRVARAAIRWANSCHQPTTPPSPLMVGESKPLIDPDVVVYAKSLPESNISARIDPLMVKIVEAANELANVCDTTVRDVDFAITNHGKVRGNIGGPIGRSADRLRALLADFHAQYGEGK